MLKVSGVSPPLIQGLMKQAAAYWRADIFSHFQKHLILQNLSTNETSVASVVSAGPDSHGLAYFESEVR